MKGRCFMRGRKSPVSVRLRSRVPSTSVLARLGVFSLFICLFAVAVNFGSAAKSGSVKRVAPGSKEVSTNPVKTDATRSALTNVGLPLTPALVTLPLALQAAPVPSIETYNCQTQAAQTVFELNDRVCARATGVRAAAFPEFKWRVSWVDPAGLIEESDLAEVDTATEYDYTLPTTDTSNRGSDGGI